MQLLIEATRDDEAPVDVVLTMRSDFLGDCSQFRELPEAINQGLYLVPRLTRSQLREAITAPAAVGGATLSPRLVQRLLNDAGTDPDMLPVVQHAMMRTWDIWARDGRRRARSTSSTTRPAAASTTRCPATPTRPTSSWGTTAAAPSPS